MFYILCGLLLALIFYWRLWRPRYYWKKFGIPYLKPFPILGNYYRVVLGLRSIMEEILHLYNAMPGQKIMGLHVFNTPLMLIRDPEVLKTLTIKDFDHFVDHAPVVFTEADDPLLFKHLFSMQGTKWRKMRATLSPAFTGNKMRGMFNFMSECGEQLINYYMDDYQKKGDKILEADMKILYTQFTNDVIASTAFGIKIDSFKHPNNDFFKYGSETNEIKFWRMLMIDILPQWLLKAMQLGIFRRGICNFFRGLIRDTLAVRARENIIRPDMLHLLMEAREGNLNHEEQDHEIDKGFSIVQESAIGKSKEKLILTEEDILAQATAFFIAGFQTSSTLMCFTSYELAVNVEIQRRLQKEIDETLVQSDGKLTYEALQDMEYLDMVISETLRKWPPGLQIDRKCTKAYTLHCDDYVVNFEPGMTLLIPIYGYHMDPKYFPNPEQFDPERFSKQNKTKILPSTYLPFGIGPRNCIGSRFALLEIKVSLFYLLSKFDIVVIKKSPVPMRPNLSSLTLGSRDGFLFGLERRR